MANKNQFNFSGGMNSRAAPLLLKENESEFILNYILDKVGALWRRGGYGIPKLTVASRAIKGLFNFYRNSTFTNYQVAAGNNVGNTAGVLYRLDAGVWTAKKTDDNLIAGALRVRFVTFVDRVFRTNGLGVVYAAVDAATWLNSGSDGNVPPTIVPKYSAVFQDRLYFAEGGGGFTSRLWFSSLPTGGAITWDITNNWVDINPDDGDEITALENNGNRLLIFKKFALYRWTFGQVEPDKIIGVGTASQESVKTNFDLGITFFFNQNGVYAYTGNRPKLISRKIQQYIDAVSAPVNTFAAIDEDHYYLSVGDITVDGRTITNAVFCYQISLDAWTISASHIQPSMFALLADQGVGMQIAMGATDGNTYNVVTFRNNAGNGTAPYTADNTTTIKAEARSREIMLSFPQRTNLAWLDAFSLNQGTSIMFYDFDRQNNFVEFDKSLTQRITTLRLPDRECNSVRVKVTDTATSVDQKASIFEGFNIEHQPKEKRDEPKVATRIRASGYNAGGRP